MDLQNIKVVQADYESAVNYCFKILPKVSRSFAIGIEFLAGELQNAVLVGYLLCRIIDTIEDDKNLPWALKEKYLKEFSLCFEKQNYLVKYQKISQEIHGDHHHINLLFNVEKVFLVYHSLKKPSQEVLKKCVLEMANGMALFVRNYPEGIRIASIPEYKEYCYYVAGTVGVLLTDLWKIHGRKIDNNIFNELSKNAVLFGEALQTVNILKDISWDFYNENSIYIPKNVLFEQGLSHENFLDKKNKVRSESAVKEMLVLANKDIECSLNYLQAIPIANFRIRFFCIFPLLLAIATLNKINKSDNMLTPEKVIKVTRKQVAYIKVFSLFASLFNFLLKNNILAKFNFLK